MRETSLFRNETLVCIYNQSLSGKPDDESYKEFAQEHLLQENGIQSRNLMI